MLSPNPVPQHYRHFVFACALTMINACGGADTESDTPDTPAAPTVSLTAAPAEVDYNGQTSLSWSSTDSDSCVASGGWTGARDPSGNEGVGPLTESTTYMLQCSGSGGSANRSFEVTVLPPPMLSFSADRTSVSAGESVTLSWSSSATDNCRASGDWSGSKAPNGQEIVGPLQTDSAFTLTCSTNSGALEDTVNVDVTTTGGDDPSLDGNVDSSFIDSNGLNKVYIFAGDVQPDDYDGDSGDPVYSATVTQDPGGCTWSYGLTSGLQDGLYTVAFTDQAGSDNPASNESLNFVGRTTLNLSGGPVVHNFVPTNIIRVGPTRAYATLAQASQAASSGDVVEIDAGVYLDDISVWRQNNLTIRGINGRAHLRAVAMIGSNGSDQQNGKGIIVSRGDNVRFENIEFSGARVPDSNGAGIRAEGGDLTICNSYFHDNENGILGFGNQVLIEYSEFYNNGLAQNGLSHNIYINDSARFIFRNSYSHQANIGHNLKSRARENFILYSRLMDEVGGTSSYAVDLPNGGLSYVIGNLIHQGTQAQNPVMFSYGAEGLRQGAVHRLYTVNNSFVNDRQSGTFIKIAAGTELAQAKNNLFVGSGNPINGTAQQASNLQTSVPGFVDLDNFNYRLAPGSVAINAGTAPGSGDGYSLVPVEHYVYPYDSEPRVQSGAIDIGAYEYTP